MTLTALKAAPVDTHLALQREEQARIRTTLATVPIFKGLNAAVIEDLGRRVTVRRVLGGGSIVHQGDPGESLYVIMAGRVKVVMVGDSGREVTLSVLRAIDIFGEMSIFDGRARSATVTAIVPTTLLVLSREDLENHLAAHPQTALQLLTEMAHRLRRADQAIAELALYDVSERLMRRLVGLAREDQLESPEGLVIRRRPTQQDLANMVGSCRETINRAYNTLVKKGLVFTRGRSLVVSMQLVQRLEPSTPQALRPSAVATRTLSIAPRVH